jgi:hypothetical protein
MEAERQDLTRAETYRRAMDAAVQQKREWLLSMGFNPDSPKDRQTCEWLTWHLAKRY